MDEDDRLTLLRRLRRAEEMARAGGGGERQLPPEAEELGILKQSVAYRLGRLLVDAAKRPARLASVPFGVAKLFMETRRGRPPAVARTLEPPSEPLVRGAPAATGPGGRTQAHALPKDVARLRMAGICDDFTAQNLALELDFTALHPERWREQIAGAEPHLLFVESAWQGCAGEWAGDVVGCSSTLREIVAACRANGIPTVFWNKEDPLHFEAFIATAALFDVVLTTDADMVPDYRRALGHDNVHVMPFALQPRLHHPIRSPGNGRIPGAVFAGAWYRHHPARCEDFTTLVDALALVGPVAIFDRNSGSHEPGTRFPQRYHAFWNPSVPYPQTADIFRSYVIGLSMNTVKRSSTMFARRALELMGAGCSVYSNYSCALKSMFADLVVSTDDGDRILQHAYHELGDARGVSWRIRRLAALRKVLSEHTWEARLRWLGGILGDGEAASQPVEAVVVLRAGSRSDVERAQAMIDRQAGVRVRTWVDAPDGLELPRGWTRLSRQQLVGRLSDIAAGCWVAGWWLGDAYGRYYLLDLHLSRQFPNVGAIGKAAYRSRGERGGGESDPQLEYAAVESLALRRCIIAPERWEGSVAEFVDALETGAIHGDGLLSNDALSYLESGAGVELEEDRCWPADTGWTTAGIERQLQRMRARPVPAESPDALGAVELAGLFRDHDQLAVSISLRDGAVELVSRTGSGRAVLHSAPVPRSRLEREEAVRVRVNARPNATYDLRVQACSADGRVIAGCAMPAGVNVEFLPPEGTATYRFELVVRGSFVDYIRSVQFDWGGQRPLFLPGEGRVLLLTNRYPSPDDLYRNAFVHRRVLEYKARGVLVDVLCVSRREPALCREFEGVQVRSCDPEALAETLLTSAHETIAVHFLDREVWKAIEHARVRDRVTIWVHGAEAQPLDRRRFNLRPGDDLPALLADSDARMQLWKQVVGDPEIRLALVSRTLASQLEEDVGMPLNEERARIIHNPIDTRLFAYRPKPVEQRTSIVLARPHHSAIYANDLAARVIEQLSGHEVFPRLRFTLVGDGPLFEENFGSLRRFSNVRIIRAFLPQQELAGLYAEHGVFLVPTRGDTQGVSRDEAMACGLVPVTNQVGAIPEFVDASCGIIAPPEDHSAMCNGILRLVNEPGLFERMSRQAAMRVRGQSAADKVIPQELEWIGMGAGRTGRAGGSSVGEEAA